MTRRFAAHDERGMALPLAVFALVVIGALVAGIFFTGRIEQRSGTNTAPAAQAFESAEAGAAMLMANWGYSGIGIGTPVAIGRTSLGGKSAYSGSVTRLTNTTFLLQVQGEEFSSNAQTDATLRSTRLIGRLLKLAPVSVSIQAALLARGDVTVRGTSNLSGNDTHPPTWSGCGTADDLAGIRTTGDVRMSGSPDIEGDPPYEEFYAGLEDTTFMRPFNQLKANMDIELTGDSYSPSPVVVSGQPTVCNTSLISNWGEPIGGSASGVVVPCQSHFPVIYRNGNLRLNNGRGQGVLLVQGDLDLAGNFEFNGIIIVTGTFDASHGTNVVHGAVMSSNATLDDMTLAGTPTVNYSACAVERALNGGANVSPLGGRGWVHVY